MIADETTIHKTSNKMNILKQLLTIVRHPTMRIIHTVWSTKKVPDMKNMKQFN